MLRHARSAGLGGKAKVAALALEEGQYSMRGVHQAEETRIESPMKPVSQEWLSWDGAFLSALCWCF